MSPHIDRVNHTSFADRVRLFIFQAAAGTGCVPQAPAIASGLGAAPDDVAAALHELAAAKVIVLAPNTTNIWIAAPFCAVPTGFRVTADDTSYFGICIWDALGIVAATGARTAIIHTSCGDCGEPITLSVQDGKLEPTRDVVHFAVPARNWWDNIGFT